jgi:hypothetical protein
VPVNIINPAKIGENAAIGEQEIACRLPRDGGSLNFSALEKKRPPGNPAQNDLSPLDLSALPRAAARERHRHRFQRGAGKGRRRQAHAAAQRPRLLRHVRHARPRLRCHGTVQKNFRRTRHVALAAGHPGRRRHLGLALVSYRGFEKEGFEIVAAFDAEPRRKRDKEIKQPIYGMDELPEFVKKQNVKMAILTVPAAVAQEVANTLIEAGVTGILNFSPIVLSVPEEVMVNNVNLAIELENLSYFTQE